MEAESYQTPVLGIDAQGARFGKGAPCCNSSIEILSGERTKAMCPSRGGRLMVTPASSASKIQLGLFIGKFSALELEPPAGRLVFWCR
jgi:hypothetical protein